MSVSASRSLVANGLSMLAARLLVPAFSFAINVGVARLLGPDVLGSYVHLLALAAIFQVAAGAGMANLLTREIASHPEQTGSYLRRARSLAALTGVAATIAFGVAAWLAAPEHGLAAAILATTVLPSSWIAVQESFFMATRTHHRVALVAAFESGLKLALAWVAFKTGGGLTFLCVGVAVSRLLALAVGSVLVSRAGASRAWRPAGWEEIRTFAAGVIPFAVLLILSTIYFKLDVLLVEALLGAGLTGIYGAALAFYSVALLVPESVMAAVYPRLSAQHRASPEGFAEATLTAMRVVTAGLVPAALGLICLSNVLLRVAYGGRYAAAAPVLRLLAASLPLHAANGALGQALLAGRLQGRMVVVVLSGLLSHALLCLLLLPRFGLIGAPVSLFLSSAIVTIGTTLVFHRQVAPLAPSARALVAVAAGAASIAATLAAPGAWSFLTAAVGLGVTTLVARKVLLSPSEWERLRQGMRGAGRRAA